MHYIASLTLTALLISVDLGRIPDELVNDAFPGVGQAGQAAVLCPLDADGVCDVSGWSDLQLLGRQVTRRTRVYQAATEPALQHGHGGGGRVEIDGSTAAAQAEKAERSRRQVNSRKCERAMTSYTGVS